MKKFILASFVAASSLVSLNAQADAQLKPATTPNATIEVKQSREKMKNRTPEEKDAAMKNRESHRERAKEK